MTNTIETSKDPKSKNGLSPSYAMVITVCAVTVLFIIALVHAYMHSDGTPYAAGREFGIMLRNFTGSGMLKNGVGLGSIIAVLTSWERNKSILWAILHAFFGWLYVLYFALSRTSTKYN